MGMGPSHDASCSNEGLLRNYPLKNRIFVVVNVCSSTGPHHRAQKPKLHGDDEVGELPDHRTVMEDQI